MLKFSGLFENEERFRKARKKTKLNSFDLLHVDIPTVDDVDETLASMYQDTIRQILTGQGIYWGYECETYSDNEIREFELEFLTDTPIIEQSKRKSLRETYIHRKYRGMDRLERKVVRMISRQTKITITQAMIKYLNSIR